MKILFVSEQFWPKAAGGEVWSWDLCRELARRGNNMTIFTSRYGDRRADERPIKGLRIRRFGFPISKIGERLLRYLSTRAIVRAVKKEIINNQPDVIHVSAYALNMEVSRLAQRHGIPCITVVHSFFGQYWKGRIVVDDWIVRPAEKKRIQQDKSTIMHVPSIYLQKIILEETGKKTIVIPNWCPDRFPKPKRFKTPTLVFVGSLEPVKDPLACIPVAKRLQMPLVVIGSGSLEKRLLRAARDADIALTIMPRATREETLAIIGGATLALVPSVTESFSLVALEAVSQGTPVAGTPVGILPELPGVVAWPPKRVPKRLTTAQIAAVRERFAKRKAVDAIERCYAETASALRA